MKWNAECLPHRSDDCEATASEGFTESDSLAIVDTVGWSFSEAQFLIANVSGSLRFSALQVELKSPTVDVSNYHRNVIHPPPFEAWQLDTTALSNYVLGLSVIVGALGMTLASLGTRLRALNLSLDFQFFSSRRRPQRVRSEGAFFKGEDSLTGFLSRYQLIELGDCFFSSVLKDEPSKNELGKNPLKACDLSAQFTSDFSSAQDSDRGSNKDSDSAHSGSSLGLLCFNINQFSAVNAELGYEAGDELLCELCNRFEAVVRSHHLLSAVLARTGGDEFALLVTNESETTLSQVSKDFTKALSKPVLLRDQPVSVSCRVAAAVARMGELTRFSDLLSRVSIAMAVEREKVDSVKRLQLPVAHLERLGSKRAGLERPDTCGLGKLTFFEPAMEERVRSRAMVERSLVRAISQQQFRLHYQPIVDLSAHASGLHSGGSDTRHVEARSAGIAGKCSLSPIPFKTVGFEALIRWQHPELGLLQPGQFLPMAEEMGLMISLDRWVMERVCRQIVAWRRSGLATDEIVVNINLSAGHLMEPDLVAYIQRLLAYYSVAPNQLNLEVTEGELIADLDRAAAVLQQIRALGLSISLDDFGTGYSSLTYLDRFPADVLKIDQSFIRRMSSTGKSSSTGKASATGKASSIASSTGNKDANSKLIQPPQTQSPQIIVKAILDLAESLNMRVVAEGIEQCDQLEQLQAMRCGYGQGFLFSRPADASSAEALLLE